jgi:hypothetical protein
MMLGGKCLWKCGPVAAGVGDKWKEDVRVNLCCWYQHQGARTLLGQEMAGDGMSTVPA